jgi:propanol-preferring alcohol dehydrogenase
MTTMQAWKCYVGDSNPLRRIEVPIPSPGPEDVLLKILAMGVCHTDCTLLALKEPIHGMGAAFILGHEGVGEILQLGSQVNPIDFSIGDRVGVYLNAGCHAEPCLECSRGMHQLCKSEGGHYGIGRDGVFAEYIAVHHRAAFLIPANLDNAHAAVAADAVVTAYHAVKTTAAVQPHQTIVIYGLGGLGLNALQTAQHLGVDNSRILVVDKRQSSIEAAIALDVPRENAFCTSSSNPSPQTLQESITSRNLAIDTCIDFAGDADTVTSAQMILRPGGTLVLVGLLAEEVPLLPLVAVAKGLTIKGSYNGSVEAYRECLDLMGKGILTPEVQTGSVEDLRDVLRRLDEGGIKGRMVLMPDWRALDESAAG